MYTMVAGNTAAPGHMPSWLAREVTRVAAARPAGPRALPAVSAAGPPGRRAAYLDTVIQRGTARLTAMTDGRKRGLSALAYQAGGLLAWSGRTAEHITGQLIEAGTASGLRPAVATRIVHRAVANGAARPITPSALSDQRPA